MFIIDNKISCVLTKPSLIIFKIYFKFVTSRYRDLILIITASENKKQYVKWMDDVIKGKCNMCFVCRNHNTRTCFYVRLHR